MSPYRNELESRVSRLESLLVEHESKAAAAGCCANHLQIFQKKLDQHSKDKHHTDKRPTDIPTSPRRKWMDHLWKPLLVLAWFGCGLAAVLVVTIFLDIVVWAAS